MDYSTHRVALRRAYIHAVTEINGPGVYDQTDDAFMDSMDRRLLELSKRKSPFGLPSARGLAAVASDHSFRQLNNSTADDPATGTNDQ